MSAEDVRDELAETLGAMPEAVNVFDHTDEATTILTAPVDLIADVVLASDWLAEYVATKQTEVLALARRRAVRCYPKGMVATSQVVADLAEDIDRIANREVRDA